jgi:hypothetical protein
MKDRGFRSASWPVQTLGLIPKKLDFRLPLSLTLGFRLLLRRPVRLQADSVCVHGDTPNAVEIARTVRAALESAGVQVARVESPLRHTRQAV